MSEIPMTTRCPKCGYNSRDDHICDACGAIFAKVRQREVEQEILGSQDEESVPLPHGTTSSGAFFLRTLIVLVIVAIGGGTYWYQIGQYKFPTTARLITWHRQVVNAVRQNYASQASSRDKTRFMEKRMNDLGKLLPMITALPGPRDALEAMCLAALQGANEIAMAEIAALMEGLAASDKPEPVARPMAGTDWLLDVAEKPYEQTDGSDSIKASMRTIAPAAAESLRQTVILIEDRRKQVRQELASSIEKGEPERGAAKGASPAKPK
jgi:hypothetical protein